MHSDLGNLGQAKEYYDRALAIYVRNQGPDLNAACTYNDLGIVHKNLDNLEQAKEYFDRTPAIKARNLCPDHTNVAMTYNDLGNVDNKLDNLEQAKEYFDCAEELRNVLKKIDDLKQEVHILEDQLNKDVSSFCILPPKPSHNVAPRDSEMVNTTQQLEELKNANENSLSYLYISGNPGSGKFQLAGLVAKQFFDEVKENLSATSFVMTVNAESPKTLLESYVSFARHLKCPEYEISSTHNSNDLNTDEKITIRIA